MKITLGMKLNSILNFIFCVFITSNAFSQQVEKKYPSVAVINSDTVLIFDFEQAQKLAIINEDRKRLKELNYINLLKNNYACKYFQKLNIKNTN